MNNVKRLKSTLLTKKDGQWYECDAPYSGIIFFDREDYKVEGYWVENGIISKKYHSICQGELPSPIQIDCSAFENTWDDSDCYDPDFYVQLYMGKPYEGIGYCFDKGVCIKEAYYNRNGYTESVLQWDSKDFLLSEAEYLVISLSDYKNSVVREYQHIPWELCSVYASYSKSEDYHFTYGICYRNHPTKLRLGIIIRLNNELDVSYIDVCSDNALFNKEYLGLPFKLPIFPSLANYPHLPLAKELAVTLDNKESAEKIISLAKHDSFERCENIKIYYQYKQDSLTFFSDRKLFPKLEQVILSYNGAYAECLEVERVINEFRTLKSKVELIDSAY